MTRLGAPPATRVIIRIEHGTDEPIEVEVPDASVTYSNRGEGDSGRVQVTMTLEKGRSTPAKPQPFTLRVGQTTLLAPRHEPCQRCGYPR